MRISATHLKNLRVVEGSSWNEIKLDGCHLMNAEFVFSECRFRRVTIRNVTLSNVKVTRLDIADQVIDGNAAFMRAMGLQNAG